MTTLTVWKFDLDFPADPASVDMPCGAESIKVGFQGDRLWVWALVDPKAELTKHVFHIRGTGHPIKGDFVINHVGTVFKNGFVWHVFEQL